MTAATAAQRLIPSRSSVSRSSPRPIATGIPARRGEPHRGGVGVALDAEHGDAALVQRLREAEADLAEADQQHVVAAPAPPAARTASSAGGG